jgi:chromosome segregation ATPase
MRILSAFILAGAIAGTAAAQIVQAAPTVKPPPSAGGSPGIARAGTLSVSPTTADLFERAKVLTQDLNALIQQAQALGKTLADTNAKIAALGSRPDDEEEAVEWTKRMNQLLAQKASIGDQISQLEAKISEKVKALESVEQAITASQARDRAELERLRAKQKSTGKLDEADSQKLQAATERESQATSLLAAIAKRKSEASSVFVRKVGG